MYLPQLRCDPQSRVLETVAESPRSGINPPGNLSEPGSPKYSGRSQDEDRTSRTISNSLLDYEDLGEIGRGQFGSVHKVRSRDKPDVVLVWKKLDYQRMPEREKRQLQQEVQLLQTLRHPNVVQYLGKINDKTSSQLYLIMEFCDGGDLGKYLEHTVQKGYKLPEEKILMWFSQLVDALHYCHNLPHGRVLHRDLKPQNVLITNNFTTVKLGDFGLAKMLKPQQLMAQTHVGTPYYMSPEVLARNRYDAKSDIWSLGCLLYEMMTGKSPYSQATTYDDLKSLVVKGNLEEVPAGYSDELYHLVIRMLAKEPGSRPTTEELRSTFVFRLGRLLRVVDVVENLDGERRKLRAQRIALEEKNRRLLITNESLEKKISSQQQMLLEAQSTIKQLEKKLNVVQSSKNAALVDIDGRAVSQNRICNQRSWETDITRDTSISVSGDDNLHSDTSSVSGSVARSSDGFTNRTAPCGSVPIQPSSRTSVPETCKSNSRVIDSEFLAKMKARINRAHLHETTGQTVGGRCESKTGSFSENSSAKYKLQEVPSRVPCHPGVKNPSVIREQLTNRTSYENRLPLGVKSRRSNSQRITSAEIGAAEQHHRQRSVLQPIWSG